MEQIKISETGDHTEQRNNFFSDTDEREDAFGQKSSRNEEWWAANGICHQPRLCVCQVQTAVRQNHEQRLCVCVKNRAYGCVTKMRPLTTVAFFTSALARKWHSCQNSCVNVDSCPNTDSCLNTDWTKNGPKLDPNWTQNGPKMEMDPHVDTRINAPSAWHTHKRGLPGICAFPVETLFHNHNKSRVSTPQEQQGPDRVCMWGEMYHNIPRKCSRVYDCTRGQTELTTSKKYKLQKFSTSCHVPNTL